MDVSIIIVNYNTRELTRDCLVSIYEQSKDITFEVIVSDNGSTDGSIELIKTEFSQVILIENKANIGFGAANNRGLAIAKGKYILYLNSDTLLLNNAVKIFYEFWENYYDRDNLGVIGCNLRNKTGDIVHSYGTFPNINKEIFALIYRIIKYFMFSIMFCIGIKKINSKKISFHIGKVDYIVGADLFLLNDSSALFDERFFLYSEEVDLEYGFKKLNKDRLLIDGPEIIHIGGGSENQSAFFDLLKQSNFLMPISKLLYFRKHTKSIFRIVIIKLLIIILWLNPLLLKTSRKYFLKMIKV